MGTMNKIDRPMLTFATVYDRSAMLLPIHVECHARTIINLHPVVAQRVLLSILC